MPTDCAADYSTTKVAVSKLLALPIILLNGRGKDGRAYQRTGAKHISRVTQSFQIFLQGLSLYISIEILTNSHLHTTSWMLRGGLIVLTYISSFARPSFFSFGVC